MRYGFAYLDAGCITKPLPLLGFSPGRCVCSPGATPESSSYAAQNTLQILSFWRSLLPAPSRPGAPAESFSGPPPAAVLCIALSFARRHSASRRSSGNFLSPYGTAALAKNFPPRCLDPEPRAARSGAHRGDGEPRHPPRRAIHQGAKPMSESATAQRQAVQVEYLDPKTLILDRNVRFDPRLDKDFIGSIKERGVLVPIVAVRTAEGGIKVRLGGRRTLGAIEAEQADVPVMVVADERTDDAGEIDRIIEQWSENHHREPMSEIEDVSVVAQLLDLGLTAGQIQRRTRMRKRSVDAAVAIAGSELAKVAQARYEFLSLRAGRRAGQLRERHRGRQVARGRRPDRRGPLRPRRVPPPPGTGRPAGQGRGPPGPRSSRRHRGR